MPERGCARLVRRALAVFITLVVPVASAAASLREEFATLKATDIELFFFQPGKGAAEQSLPPVESRKEALQLLISRQLSSPPRAAGTGLKLGGALKRPLNWRDLQRGREPASLSLRASPAIGRDSSSRAADLAASTEPLSLRAADAVSIDPGVKPVDSADSGLSAESMDTRVSGLWPTGPTASETSPYSLPYSVLGVDGKEPEAETASTAPTLVPTHLTLNGTVYTDYRSNYGTNIETNTSRASGLNSSLGVAGYVWQPWFAQVSGGVTVGLTQSSLSQGEGSSSYSVTGRGSLAYFPISFFPGEVFVDRSTTESLGIASTRNELVRFGLTQNLRPRGTTDNYTVGYDRSISTTLSSGVDVIESRSVSDAYRLALAQTLFGQRFNLSGSYNRTLNEATANQAENLSGILNATLTNNYVFDEFSSLQSDAGYSSSEFLLGGARLSSTRFYQLGNNYNWRSEDYPLTGTAAFRGSMLEVDAGGGLFRSTQMSINSGLSYQLSPKVSFSGAAGLNRSNTAISQFGSLGATYQGDSRVFRGFSHTWSANSRATYTTGQVSSVQTSVGAGQSLSRSWQDIVPGMLFLNATQNMSANFDNAGGGNMNVSHAGNASWSYSRGVSQISVSGGLADSRSFGDNSFSSQMVTFQTTGGTQLTRNSRLSASVASQGNRQFSEGVQTDFVFNTSGVVTYDTSRFLGIRQLFLTSSLKAEVVPENARTAQDIPGWPINMNWDSRLTYRLGRTYFQAQAQAQSVAGINSGLVYFRVERQLGF